MSCLPHFIDACLETKQAKQGQTQSARESSEQDG